MPQTHERTCSAEDCTVRHYAKGLCKKHYTQVLRHSELTPERERGTVRVCKVDGCGRTDTISYYCRKHARQIRVHGRLTPEREHVVGFEGCRVKGCDGEHRAKGLCARHYNQARWKQKTSSKRQGSARSKRRT